MSDTEEIIDEIDEIIDDPVGNDPVDDPIDQKKEDDPKKKEVVKRAYTMTPKKMEQLAKARERAYALRKEYYANRTPPPKKERVKVKSKLEVEIENLTLKKKIEENINDASSAFPLGNDKPIDKPIDKTIEKAVVVDACSAFPLGNDKEVVVDKPIIEKKPSIFRNENGFYCI
jgi:hypothetical protein